MQQKIRLSRAPNNRKIGAVSSRDNIVKNPDGSADLYFGPKAQEGKPETNWIKTLPGKGWFSLFRLNGPTRPYFDRS